MLGWHREGDIEMRAVQYTAPFEVRGGETSKATLAKEVVCDEVEEFRRSKCQELEGLVLSSEVSESRMQLLHEACTAIMRSLL